MKNDRTRVAVGLSGGVDSSVAAVILKRQGYEIIGLTMEIYDGPSTGEVPGRHACYGPGEKVDIENAAAVCRKMDIPYHVFDLREEFRNHVLEYFRNEYLTGRTPNPCVVCNQRLKFGFLINKAKEAGLDFDCFATGHYARIVHSDDRFRLHKSVDSSKDQTYFLYALTQDQLSRTLFPLGAYYKRQVREMARSYGLVTAEMPESQGFIDGGDYAPLFRAGEIMEGEITDEEGNVMGKHRGIIHYTIGQRRGLGLTSKNPLYVLRIDAPANRIVVGGRKYLFSKSLIATDLNLIAVNRVDRPYRVKAKIRLKHREAPAMVFPHAETRIKIVFDYPQKSVAPGQSVVLYSGDAVFGGGIIESVQ